MNNDESLIPFGYDIVNTNADKLMRRLRLRHIELLDALAHVPTMHAAAQRLNLSQPAVSKMLREVEYAFGDKLFDRSKSGVKANMLGLVAIRWAQVISNEVAVAADEIAVARSGAGPLLRLGTISVTSIVPAAIVSLRKSVSAVVQIREGAVDVLIERLLVGELDCVVGALAPGILGGEELKNLSVRSVSEDRLCIVASPHHRFAKAKRLSWADLCDEPWVLPPSQTMVRQAFIAAYLQGGLLVPQPAVETLSPVTLSSLVRADHDLLGVMRSEQIRGEHESIALAELRVFPFIPLPPLSLFTRRSRSNPSPLVGPFFSALKAAASERRK